MSGKIMSVLLYLCYIFLFTSIRMVKSQFGIEVWGLRANFWVSGKPSGNCDWTMFWLWCPYCLFFQSSPVQQEAAQCLCAPKNVKLIAEGKKRPEDQRHILQSPWHPPRPRAKRRPRAPTGTGSRIQYPPEKSSPGSPRKSRGGSASRLVSTFRSSIKLRIYNGCDS